MKTRLKNVICVLFCVCLLFPFISLSAEVQPGSTAAIELEPVAVTATLIPTPIDQVASSITVVTGDEIEARGTQSLEEALRDVPGVDVVRTGGPGSRASLLIRGGRDEDVLVLIDGIEANDPIEFGRSFDFGLLALDDIDRIEIVRGPQSTLYGSDAMAGVVQIFTRRGQGPPTGRVRLDYGSFETNREVAGLSGAAHNVSYSLSLSRFETQGISSADEDDGNSERDGYRNVSLAGRVIYCPRVNTELGLVFRAFDANSELDNHGGWGGDDPNYTLETRRGFIRPYLDLWLLDGKWHQNLSASYADHERDLSNKTDPDHPLDSEEGKFRSDLWKLAWQNDLYFGDHHLVTIGAEYEEESGESEYESASSFGTYKSKFPEKTAITRSAFLQEDFHLKGFGAVAGLRRDSHDRFGEHTSYRAAATYKIDATDTRFRAAWGTGFKAPSLFQLYSSYGDPGLEPEQSESWEAGIEQGFMNDRIGFSVTYFDLRFENLIDYNLATYKYENISGARSRGWEIGAETRPIESLLVSLAYTNTDARDKDTGEPLIRRSGEKYSGSMQWRPIESVSLNLYALHVGSRPDLDFTSGKRVRLDPYTRVDAAVNWRARKAWTLSLRAENIANEDYEEAYGFGTPGRSLYAGVRYEFPLRSAR